MRHTFKRKKIQCIFFSGALMAKAGKKVLILEQHDQAGGCCHTFIDKGYEFDVGIHYIGKMGHPNINKTYMDQICDGQLEWKEMEVSNFKDPAIF